MTTGRSRALGALLLWALAGAAAPAAGRADALPETRPGDGPTPAPGPADRVEAPASPESLFAVGAEVDLRSRYVWHGLPLSTGPVVQPAVWGAVWQCSLTAWANTLLPAPGQDAALDEIDLGLACELAVSIVEIELGAWAYFFEHSGAPPTGEAKLAVTVPIGWFRVFTAHGVDIGQAPGAYAGEVGVGGAWDFEAVSLEAALSTGWATAYFNDVNAGVDEAALDFAAAGLAVPVELGAGLSLRPHAAVSVLLPDALRDAFGGRVVIDFGVAFGGEWPL